VGNYSLGMRQRLGIATALVGDPTALILDEPANGLDPAGIRWMRDLLRDYADQGGTVLLSSHLLHEIEIIADDIVMIGQGRIVCQGSKEELLQAAGTIVRARDVDALQRALDMARLAWTPVGDGSLRSDADASQIGLAALQGGVAVTELRTADSGGLEDMFLELTAETQRERTAA
jgi:ABC-2 type transport system ATP-binding protein